MHMREDAYFSTVGIVNGAHGVIQLNIRCNPDSGGCSSSVEARQIAGHMRSSRGVIPKRVSLNYDGQCNHTAENTINEGITSLSERNHFLSIIFFRYGHQERLCFLHDVEIFLHLMV